MRSFNSLQPTIRRTPGTLGTRRRRHRPPPWKRRLEMEVLEGRALPSMVFKTIDVPGSTASEAWGINDAGQVVGNYTAGGVTHGYLLSEGSYTTLDVPGATSTSPSAINDSGQIAGSYVADGITHAFILSDGVYTTIDAPDA